jgi:uncharacterized protein (DUF302 family)
MIQKKLNKEPTPMKKLMISALLVASTLTASDLTTVTSLHSLNKTANLVMREIKKSGSKVLTQVKYANAKSILYRNKKIESTLLACNGGIIHDLPFKITIIELDGTVNVHYTAPDSYLSQYGMGEEQCLTAVDGLSATLNKIAAKLEK